MVHCEMTEPMPIPLWMIVGAFRYALGRMSTAPSNTADWLVDHWEQLPELARELIQREHDVDRDSWNTVRALWDK